MYVYVLSQLAALFTLLAVFWFHKLLVIFQNNKTQHKCCRI